MTSQSKEVWIDRYLRRVHWGQFLQRAAEGMAGYLFLVGSIVLVVKLFVPALWPQALWLGCGTFLVAIIAWLLSRRDPFTRTESVAMIDRRLNAGGLLMTLCETPDAEWEKRLPEFETTWRNSLPKLRPTRFARLLVLPLVFAFGACFVPLREASTAPILRNTVGQQASQQLEEMLQQLDDASVLDEEEKKQLREEIQKLAEETKHTPLTHEKWETVDALRDKMRIRLDASALSIMKASDALAALAKAGDADAPALSAERTVRLEKDVLDALQRLATNGKFAGASPELRDQLEKRMKDGQFRLPQDPTERQKLLDDLQDFLDQESDALSKLRQECAECEQCRGGT